MRTMLTALLVLAACDDWNSRRSSSIWMLGVRNDLLAGNAPSESSLRLSPIQSFTSSPQNVGDRERNAGSTVR